MTNDIQSFSETVVKDAIAHLRGTTNLRSGLPHDLGKVRRFWIVGIIGFDFICPGLDCSGYVITTANASSKVFATPGMLENTVVGPCLCGGCEVLTPCQVFGAMLAPDGIVASQESLDGRRGAVGRGRSSLSAFWWITTGM